jgi:site-specific DNA-cytosine methylase
MKRVVDLFCGMGGFSKGMQDAGFNIVAGVDLDKQALESYQLNFPNAKAIQADIKTLTIKDLPEHDLLIGSPPCQKFSQANYYNRNNDKELIDAFKRLAVKEWAWENVVGAKQGEEGVTLDAQDFGIAQRRKRFFSASFDLNNIPLNSNKVYIKDVLTNIEGEGLLDGFNSTVYSLDKVCPTIRRIPLKWYDGRPMGKPFRFTGFKHLTIEDHLTLMGFNKSWNMTGGKTSKMLQIGNAVVPAVAEAIANALPS